MPHTLATEAEFILAGFRAGYYSIADVIAWADRQIERLPEPPTALLDLSMGRTLYPVDFINLLRTLSPRDGSVAIQILLVLSEYASSAGKSLSSRLSGGCTS